jgi:hypothetical protein
MDHILMIRSMTAEYNSTIGKTQLTASQYSVAHGSLSSCRGVTIHIYQMKNCTEWSSVLIMELRLKLRVKMVKPYL